LLHTLCTSSFPSLYIYNQHYSYYSQPLRETIPARQEHKLGRDGDGILCGDEEHGKAGDDSSRIRINGGAELISIITEGGVRGGDREGDELPVVRNREGGGANEGVLRCGDRNQGAAAGVPVLLHWASS